MKRFILIFILLQRCLAVDAQYDLPLAIEDPKMDAYLQNRPPASLIIQIINAPDTVKKVDIKCTFVTFGSNVQLTKYYTTDAHGYEKIILTENLPYQQIWLSVGDYLYAGVYINSGLRVTIDASHIKIKDGVFLIGDGIFYSGIDGELNTIMNKHILYKRDEQNNLKKGLNQLLDSRKNYSTNLFSKKIDSVWEDISRINEEFLRQYPKYKWAINNEAASEFYSLLCISYWSDTIPDNLFTQISNHKPYFTSNDGVEFYNYLNIYQNRKAPKEITKKIKIIDSAYPYAKSDILKTFLLAQGKDSFALTYPEILTSMKTEWCKRLVENELEETTIKQKKIDSLLASAKQLNSSDNFIGTPIEQLPFDASLYKLDSIKNVNDFVLSLISKFKNKGLVIDFWATWCSPCLHEMPLSKQLHETNKDLPVEYIYICTNSASSIKLWKNKIAELQLPGTHIFMNEKIIEELKSSFNNAGSGYPTYVIIDVNGKLRPKALQSMQSIDRDKLMFAIGLK